VSEDSKLLELYDVPLYGPMIEVYRRLREDYERIVEQREQEHDEAPPICYRTLEGVPLCQKHGDDVMKVRFLSQSDLRSVWDDETVVRVAETTGQRLDDLRRLHGRFYAETCAMCGVTPSLNLCLNCSKVLHPQWPAVYCSNRCAMEDA